MANELSHPIGDNLSDGIRRVKKFFSEGGSEPMDIISLIEEDHKPLKDLIKIMKDSDRPLSERSQAFADFAPLLMTHAKSEEKSLYDFMKAQQTLREHAFEGDAEHSVADQMVEEIKRTTDKDQFSAKIKVLAELVEHHIKEEEESMLPEVKKEIAENILIELSQKYIAMQEKIISEGQDDAPPESEIRAF